MEIPAGEQLPCLFSRVAGGRPDAAPSGPLRFIRTAVIGVDHTRAAKGRQQVRHIFNPFGDDMGGEAVALDAAGDADQTPGDDRLAERLIDLFPDDYIGGAGFILQRQEDHTRSGAAALPRVHKASHPGG